MSTDKIRTANVHTGDFDAEVCHCMAYARGSSECNALEARYPGVRFNRVQIMLFCLHDFDRKPEEDYIDIVWNISGSTEDLVRHGFANPRRVHGGRARTRAGWRFDWASFDDGLDRIAGLFMPAILGRFKRR